MEVSLNKTSVSCYNKIFSQTVRKEESQDSVVPDTMPDISEILETSGTLMIRSKDISDGGVRLTAGIAVNVVYKPEGEERACGLELSIPVSITVEDENIKDGSECISSISILSVDTRVLNPRKILVKAEICADISCFALGKMELCGDAGDPSKGIYVRKKTVTLTPVVAVREKTFVLTDEFSIPASKAPAKELLSRRISVTADEVKPMGNKLVFKGCVKCRMLYCTTDDMVAEEEFTSNYSQIIEIDTACSDPVAELGIMLTGAYFEVLSSGEGRVISMELHLLAQTVCCERMEASYIADAYSNTNPLSLTMRENSMTCIRRQAVLRENLREVCETPCQVLEVVGAYALPCAVETASSGLHLPVTVCMIYKANDGTIHSGRRKLEIEFPLSLEDGERVRIMSADISDLYLSPAAEGIEVHLHGELNVSILGTCEFDVVDGISCDETAALDHSGRPSLVVLKASSGDDLWSLAKENCSTLDMIRSVNGLDGEDGTWEKYLLIPKAR